MGGARPAPSWAVRASGLPQDSSLDPGSVFLAVLVQYTIILCLVTGGARPAPSWAVRASGRPQDSSLDPGSVFLAVLVQYTIILCLLKGGARPAPSWAVRASGRPQDSSLDPDLDGFNFVHYTITICKLTRWCAACSLLSGKRFRTPTG